MEARQISIEDFLSSNKTRFIIPVYQRNYDWKEKNCLQLFKDIKFIGENKEQKSHFMGSIVYVSNNDVDSVDFKEYLIIDGQQRLTTATIFLKALHDLSSDENLQDEILETFLVNKRLDEKNKLKLKPIKKDNEVFRKLLKNDFESIDKTSNIYKNYIFFKNKIQELNNFEILYNGFKKLFIVHIALNRQDDNPQLIFESINSTGVCLSQSDLIRNYLLMDKQADEQVYLFENYWFKIEENLLSENISNFVRDFLTMKQNKIPNKENTYEDFKNFVMSNKIVAKELLSELLEYSNIYKNFLFPKDELYASNIRNFIQLKISVAYPFLLSIINDFNKNKITQTQLINTLELIESYFIRRMVCNKTTNALNKVFATIYNDVLKMTLFDFSNFYKCLATVLFSKKGSGVFPDDNVFHAAFTTRDSYNLKNIKFLLLRLENKDNNEKVEISSLTIEHFMPQTLSNAWKVKLGDKYQSIHEKYLHNIGNLSLSGDNTQLGNKSFDEKKLILQEQSRLKLNQIFKDSDNWGEKEITDRANDLFSEAKKLWQYPKQLDLKCTSNSDNDKEFYTLEDEIDVTGMKISSFELFGEKYSVTSWVDLFEKVVKILFSLDEEKARMIVNDSDFIGRNRKIFSSTRDNIKGKQVEINDSLFLETNLSARSIISYVKLICEKFGLTDDNFIYIVK